MVREPSNNDSYLISCIIIPWFLVAIEKREPGEKKIQGPSIEELVEKETVDELSYMGWDDQEAQEVPSKAREDYLKIAQDAISANKNQGFFTTTSQNICSVSR